jgi:hypothetical protein
MSVKQESTLNPITSLTDKWSRETALPEPAKNYGTTGQINVLISNALLDYLYLTFRTDNIACNYGEIAQTPFEGYQGLQLSCAVSALNPVMAGNLEKFLDMVSKDADAYERDIHVFHDNEKSQRLLVYSDPRVMMEYVYLLYKDARILCDFTRFYSQTAEALAPRNNDNGFYLN